MNNYTEMKDEDLCGFIQEQKNTEKCLGILIDRHSGLCVDMINGYVSKSYNESLRQELIKEKDYQIYHTALKFDPTRGSKFSTYLGNEIKWKCLNLYNRIKKRKTIPVEEDLISYFSYLNAHDNKKFDSEMFNNIINQANSHPDQRVGEIFTMRYVDGKNNSVMPWKNISEYLKMSIQGCINIHDLALNQFRKKITKEIKTDE